MTLEEFLQEWKNDSERVLVHTSGSTGKPKPLWVEKRRMEASARITCDFLGLKAGNTALLCMSLDYIAGKMMVVRSIVRNLKLIAVEPTGHPLASVSKGDIDFAAMVPMQVYNSLKVPEERERLRQIKHLIIGGSAVDEGLCRELRDFPYAVWSTYGMTETLSHIALRRLNGPTASEWYTPLPNVTVAANEEGCLVIDAPSVCGERLVTNDVVEIECGMQEEREGGVRFRIVGRKDNVVCSGGIKIQLEDVERAIRPYVNIPFMMTKRKDQKFGEVVVMLAEMKEDVQTTRESLQSLCREHLPKYWQPKDYVFVESLPMTETGKPARKIAEKLCIIPHDRNRGLP